MSKDDCIFVYDGETDCIKGTCVCQTKNRPCLLKQQKTAVTDIGGSCNEDEECNIDKSTCTQNQCICLPDYIVSSDKKKCLKGTDILLTNLKDWQSLWPGFYPVKEIILDRIGI